MTNPDPPAPLDSDFIDRLVDGGLDPAEFRAAIVRLDREPDGWKRCALTFLEAQCWRDSFRALDPPARVCLEPATPSVPQAPEQAPRRSREWRRVAMAAGIAAVSFAMGWLGHPARPSTRNPDLSTPPAPAVAIHQDTPAPLVQNPEVPDPAEPAGEFVRQPDRDRYEANPSRVVAVTRLPVGNPPPRLSEHQLALLERHGYQVDQHRRIITTTLNDGRRVTVPVDQVRVHYTGNNPL